MNFKATHVIATIYSLLFVALLPHFTSSTKVHKSINNETSSGKTLSNTFRDVVGAAFKSRYLQSNGSFDKLNALFDGTVIAVPDTDTRQDLGGIWGSVLFQIRDMTCFNIKIGNMNALYGKQSEKRILYKISISGLKIDCKLRWRYEYNIFRDSGRAQIYTANNALSTAINVLSRDFRYHPPNKVNLGGCQAKVNVRDMDFQGGLSAFVANTFEKPFRDEAEDAIRKALCEEIGNLSTDIEKILLDTSDFVKSFYGDIPEEDADPLSGQSNLVVPNGMQLLDLTDTDNSIGKWFTDGVDSIFNYLGTLIDKPSSSSSNNYGTTTKDLAINVILRDNILDENGELLLLNDDVVIHEGVDPLTETTIILKRMKVIGLDSISEFGTVDVIAPQTLQTNISWDYVKVVVDLKIIMRPSTSEDSIIVESDNPEVVEQISVEVRVSDIEATVSFLLALNQDKLGALPLGSILTKDKLLPCGLSVAHDLHLSELNFVAGTYIEPNVDNFISDGVDKLISDTVEAFHQMYKHSIIIAMPKYFATTLKLQVNNIIATYIKNADNSKCPEPSTEINGPVDLRDLFLSPDEASQLGGSGKSPYGDVIPEAKKIVDAFITEPDAINQAFIRPLTNDTIGSMLFPSDFLNVNVLGSVNISSNYARVDNIDSFGVPQKFLAPISLHPFLLSNEVQVGTGSNPLRGTIGLSLARHDPFGDQFQDNIGITISMRNVDIFSPLNVRMDSAMVLSMLLEDVANINCWLATIPSQNLDRNGFPITDDFIPNLSIEYLKLFVENMDLKINCEKCVSSGMMELPTLIQSLSSVGVIDDVLTRGLKLIEELALTENTQIRLGRIISHSNHLCPHNQLYDPLYNITQERFPPLPQQPLSQDSLDLLLLSSGIAAQVALVVTALDIHALSKLPTDPLSGEAMLEELKVNASTLLNLEELEDTFGTLFMNNTKSAEDNSEGVGLGINNIMRSLLLDDNGIYSMFPDLESLSFAGYNFTLSSLKIKGLDSFNSADMFNTLSEHTLMNKFVLDAIHLEVMVSMIENTEPQEKTTKDIVISVGLKDINITLSILMAIVKEKFRALEIGNLLQSSLILPCLMSSIDHLNVTQMVAEIGIIDTPVISGFISDDVQRILSSSMETIWDQYKSKIKSGLQSIIQTGTKRFVEKYAEDLKSTSCPLIDAEEGTLSVDFRDLFWNSSKAYEAGASGDSPYGDLSYRVKMVFDEYLADADTLNNAVIGPRTMLQSNESGTLAFTGELFKFSTDMMGFEVFGFQFENLDSFSSPGRIFDPDITDSSLLLSEFGVGHGSKPLRGSVDLSIFQVGYDGIQHKDDINIVIETSELFVFLSIFAKIDVAALLKFPVGDITNINCWLATVPSIILDESGFPVSGYSPLVSVAELIMSTVKDIDFYIDCASCERPGMIELPSMIRTLSSAGVIDDVLRRGLKFAEELSKSETTQIILDRSIYHASTQCPHDPLFNSSDPVTAYDTIPISLESTESLETLVLSAGIAAELAFAVIALDIESLSIDEKLTMDPLSGEALLEDLNINTNVFLDLTLWETKVASLLDNVLGGISTNSSGDFGINNMVQTFLLDEKGIYSLTPDLGTFSFMGFEFSLSALNIGGLDSFTEVNVFKTIAKHTIRNTFSLKSLSLEFHIKELSTNEDIFISIGLEDVAVEISVLMAIVEEKLGDIQLGSIFHTDQIFPCLMSALDKLDVTELFVEISLINEPVISGFISEEIKNVLAKTTNVIFDTYNSKLTSALQMVIKDNVHELVSNFIKSNENSTCPLNDVEEESQFVDFRDLFLNASAALEAGGLGTMPYGDLGLRVMDIVKGNFLSPNSNGIPMLNEAVIRPFTLNQFSVDGEMLFSDKIINFGGKDSANQFQISNIHLYGVDSVGYPLYFLQPHENSQTVIENAITVGAGKIFRATSSVLVKVKEGDIEVDNELLVSLELNATSLFPSIHATVDKKTLMKFPLRHVTNPSCWLSTIPAPGLNELGFPSQNINHTLKVDSLSLISDGIKFNVTCLKCSSPNIEELNSLTSFFENPLFASNYLEKLFQSRAMQDWIGRAQNEAAQSCPFNAGYIMSESDDDLFRPSVFVDDSYRAVMSFGGVVFCSILVAMGILFQIKRKTRRKHKLWLGSLTEDELMTVYNKQLIKEHEESQLRHVTKSLLTDRVVPASIRFLIPLIIFGNVALFLSGHLSLGATLDILGQVAGQDITMRNFFNFSIAESTIDMWEAGAKPLAVVIAIFSGLWPYTKQMITLVLWCAPPTVVSTSRRGSILRWLDALGKWSMIDIYILFLSLIAFRLTIVSPRELLKKDFYRVEILVIPMWGLYANMIAQLVSQVSSHFILHYHDKVVEEGRQEILNSDCLRKYAGDDSCDNDDNTVDNAEGSLEDHDTPERLCFHSFRLGWSKEGSTVQIGPISNMLVGVTGIVALGFLVVGCWKTSITLDYLGLLGIVMEVGNNFEEAVYGYSFFDFVRLLMDLASFVNTPGQYVGLGTLTALFVFSSLLVPVILVLLLLHMWFVPMTNRIRSHRLKVVEILKAWQYLEVYVLALLLGSWQLGDVSEFLFNDEYCEGFDEAFDSLVYLGFLDRSDAQCFYNKASISQGTYLLAVASFLLAWLTRFVTKAASQKHEEDKSVRSDFTTDINVMRVNEDGLPSIIDKTIYFRTKIDPMYPRFTEDYQLFLRRSTNSSKCVSDSPTPSWEKSFDIQSECSYPSLRSVVQGIIPGIRSQYDMDNTDSCSNVDDSVSTAIPTSAQKIIFPVPAVPVELDNYRDVRFFGPNRNIVNK